MNDDEGQGGWKVLRIVAFFMAPKPLKTFYVQFLIAPLKAVINLMQKQ